MLQLAYDLWPDNLLLQETLFVLFVLLSTCLSRGKEQMPMHFYLSPSEESYNNQGSELESIRNANYQNQISKVVYSAITSSALQRKFFKIKELRNLFICCPVLAVMLTAVMAHVRQHSAAALSRKLFSLSSYLYSPWTTYPPPFHPYILKSYGKYRACLEAEKSQQEPFYHKFMRGTESWCFSNEDFCIQQIQDLRAKGLGSYERGCVGVLQRRDQIVFTIQRIQRYISTWLLFIFCCKIHRKSSMLSTLLISYNY